MPEILVREGVHNKGDSLLILQVEQSCSVLMQNSHCISHGDSTLGKILTSSPWHFTMLYRSICMMMMMTATCMGKMATLTITIIMMYTEQNGGKNLTSCTWVLTLSHEGHFACYDEHRAWGEWRTQSWWCSRSKKGAKLNKSYSLTSQHDVLVEQKCNKRTRFTWISWEVIVHQISHMMRIPHEVTWKHM